MAKVSDIGGKRLISLSPSAWAKWVTGQSSVEALEIIGAEFQWVSRENDVLLKANHPDVGNFLIANELQLRYNDKLPARMRAYAALAEEKYGLPVYPVLVNILPPAKSVEIPSTIQRDLLGITMHQDYRVINLWEIEATRVFEDALAPLLPFVPILKGGGTPKIVKQALIERQKDEQLIELESLLGFFASFVLETNVIQQIMRWDMTVLRESPWYQEILHEGERKVVLRQLKNKLGSLSLEEEAAVQSLPPENLEILSDALLHFNHIEDLKTWLSHHQ